MFGDFRLQVFMTLSRTGNFTRAAAELGISQPAVSQNISELEKDLGTRLFSRSRGEVSLTPQGRSFLEYARRILYWYDSARFSFGTASDACPSPMTLEVTPDLASSVLSRLLASLRMHFHDVLCQSATIPAMYPMSPLSGRENVVRLFSTLDGSMGEDYAAISPVCAFASSASSSIFSEISEDDGDYRQFAVFDCWPDEGIDALTGAGFGHREFLRTDSAEAIKKLLLSDPRLIGILPRHCVIDELRDGTLVQVPAPHINLSCRLYCDVSDDISSSTAAFVRRRLQELLSYGV